MGKSYKFNSPIIYYLPMDTPNTNKPLIETNPYPDIDAPTNPYPVQQQPKGNPYGQGPYNQPNQVYQPNQYQPNQYQPNRPNQGFQPNGPIQQPNQPPSPYVLNPYPEQRPQQGFQPAPNGRYVPPPPQTQVQVVQLPPYITQAHPHYTAIVQQAALPCAVCSFRGADFVSLTPGCSAYSWSVCLFCFTGFFCFWIPFVCDSCKDIRVSCSKCGHTKYIVEKPCC